MRMIFFRKSTPEEDKRPATGTPAPATEATSTNKPQPANAEEAARQWFAGRFGTDMPDEVTRMFRQIAANENKRQKAKANLLDGNELKRIHESMRLYKTKLANVAQTLDGLRAQKEWYHRNKELQSILEKYRQDFFERNKEYNARLKDIHELERFETFETVQGNYQRIKALESVLQLIRKESPEYVERFSEAQNACKEMSQRVHADEKSYQEKRNGFRRLLAQTTEGYALQTELKFYDADLREMEQYKSSLIHTLDALNSQNEETKGALEKIKEKTDQQQQLRQTLESQQHTLEKGDVIQTKLNFLQYQKKRKEQLLAVIERTRKQQQEQNEKLNRLFTTSQDTDAQIKTLKGELQVHQKSIVGMNSYDLQQRAMDLKSKREMLENATRLWKQIADGYTRVDEKSQEIMRRGHRNEALKAQIAQLEPEVTGLQTQCEELKYAYTLSKSQDVMQLRKDLQEGVSCSVCGATHHPYHSDTLLEQSKLIGEIKTDFEQTGTELKHKQALLDDLKREQALEEGRIETDRQTLEVYKQILQSNIEHWETFTTLDSTFKECSPSTNFEGRRIMLQQLVEKTGIDAEDAQKELDTFNFHQSTINTLNKHLNEKELEKDDITVRLNEVNTGCQVVAYRVEQLQQALTRTNEKFSELYEEIDKIMAISNWYKVWCESPENLRIYLQQQRERWLQLKEETTETQKESIRLQTLQENLTEQTATIKKLLNLLTEKTEQMEEYRQQAREKLHKLFEDGDVETHYKAGLEALDAAEEKKEKTRQDMAELQTASTRWQGYNQRADDTMRTIEKAIAREHSELDDWIRKYNTNHSPVQFTELEQAFNTPTDWNALREELRALTLRDMVAGARVEEARLALAAHQVNALSQGQDEDRTAALNTEIARLESEQNRLLVQLAGYQARLEAHETELQKQTALNLAGQPENP